MVAVELQKREERAGKRRNKKKKPPHTESVEVAVLEQNQLPLGFSMALTQHPKAMERFSRFTASEQKTVLTQARQASSKEKCSPL